LGDLFPPLQLLEFIVGIDAGQFDISTEVRFEDRAFKKNGA
jgi:hypothetical protein